MNTRIKNIVVCVSMAIILFSLTALCLFMPKEDFLEAERREPESFPDFTFENVMKDGVEYNDSFMSKFEKYAIDAFPFRDSFRTLKAIFANYVFCQKDNNNIYIADGQASKIEYPLKEDMIEYASQKFRYLYETYMKGKTDSIYLSIIPDKNYFIAEQNGYLALDYDRLNEMIVGSADFAEYIDIYDLLEIDDYYKTDTHWRQEAITQVAKKMLETMGSFVETDYKVNTLDHPFYGVYYGQAALPMKPDTIKYLTSEALDSCIVTSYAKGVPMKTTVYDMKKAVGRDPYEMFLGGADPLIIIENPNAKNDKELVIFRDSFGSSISPLLVEGYSKVTLVDIRYMQSTMVGNYVNFENADVLFLYSALILNTAKIFN